MDIKIDGITKDIMSAALDQAKDARLHILGEMNKVLSSTRETMSDWAPSIITLKIDPESGHLYIDLTKHEMDREDVLSELLNLFRIRYVCSERRAPRSRDVSGSEVCRSTIVGCSVV